MVDVKQLKSLSSKQLQARLLAAGQQQNILTGMWRGEMVARVLAVQRKGQQEMLQRGASGSGSSLGSKKNSSKNKSSGKTAAKNKNYVSTEGEDNGSG